MSVILQWNCDCLKTKKDELLNIIEDIHSIVVTLQETKIKEKTSFRIPNYTKFKRERHFNRISDRGVMLLVHETFPVEQAPLKTNAQLVETTINAGRTITIALAYFSQAQEFTFEILQNIILQLPKPFILLGDFNNYHTMRGSNVIGTRGRVLERLLMEHNLNILND